MVVGSLVSVFGDELQGFSLSLPACLPPSLPPSRPPSLSLSPLPPPQPVVFTNRHSILV